MFLIRFVSKIYQNCKTTIKIKHRPKSKSARSTNKHVRNEIRKPQPLIRHFEGSRLLQPPSSAARRSGVNGRPCSAATAPLRGNTDFAVDVGYEPASEEIGLRARDRHCRPPPRLRSHRVRRPPASVARCTVYMSVLAGGTTAHAFLHGGVLCRNCPESCRGVRVFVLSDAVSIVL